MKILIVGISVRGMVESAVRSGYAVIALDAFGDRDLRLMAESYSLHGDFHSQYNPDALYRASRRLSFDALAYTSNLENHPEILIRIAGDRPIIGNLPAAVAAVRSWQALSARLRQAGFSVPETLFAGDIHETDDGRRWIIKPVLSGGGHGIAFLHKPKLSGDQYVLQEYISGKSCSASFVANGHECVVIGIAEQLIGMRQFGSKGFRYCGNILPLPESLNQATGRIILEQVQQLTAFLTREYCLTGVNGIDFILNGDRIFLTEVNPRYSASMELIEQSYGLPVFRAHTQAALEGRLPEFRLEIQPKTRNFFGKTILFAEKDAIVPDTESWLNSTIRDVPVSGERLSAGHPICTVLANCPTYEETLSGLIRQAETLKEEIYG